MAKKNNDIPAEEYSISYRKAIREKIEKEITQFLLNGGQIKQVPNGFMAKGKSHAATLKKAG